MLNLMCLAYRGYGAENLAGRETPADRTKHLFTTYIDLMFKKRGKAALAYPQERTLGWLSWIARKLSERNQAMFLIEDLQPGWLTNGAQRWAYLAGFSLVVGLLMGLANIVFWQGSVTTTVLQGRGEVEGIILWLTAMPLWLLAFGWIEGLGSRSGLPVLERVPPGIRRAAVKWLVSAGLWLLVAWAGWNVLGERLLWAGVGIPLVLGAMGRNRSISYSIETVESLRWSLGHAWQGALLGLFGGLVAGACLWSGFVPWFDSLQHGQWMVPFGFATEGLALGGILGGLTPHVIETKTVPNQGIRLSLRMAILVALNALWLAAIVMVFLIAGSFDNPDVAGQGLWGSIDKPDWASRGLLGFSFFTASFTTLFLWFGGLDVIKHYVLRAVLAASRQTPWNLAGFLEQARGLNLMQRVGSAYIFVHRRLLEHLASSGQAR
jgi:hypothetical protein